MKRLLFVLLISLLLVTAGCSSTEQVAAEEPEMAQEEAVSTEPEEAEEEPAPVEASEEEAVSEAGEEGLFTGTVELPEEIVIALMGPFTGPFPAAGEDFLQGAQMAVDEINAAGGIRGSMVRFEQFDTQLSPTEAANLARSIVADENIVALIGPWSSSAVLATLPIMEEADMVLLTPSASSADIAASPVGFKFSTDIEIYGSLMAELAVKELGFKKLAVMFAQNDFAINMKTPIAAVAESLGGEVVIEEGFIPDTTDFRSILTNVKNSGAEALLLACYSQEGALILNQSKELGLDVAMIGDGVFIDEAFFDVVGENAEGVYAINPEASMANYSDTVILPEYVRAWSESFEELYGELTNGWESPTYDAFYVIAHAVDQVGTDRAAIVDYLEDFECLSTITSECFSFGELHWPVLDMQYWIWEDEGYVLFADAPETQYLPQR